ncbi:MAG TPA: HAD hydrolase-like protein [Longimicrobiales bacterium]|nr:HAD hydrolase-like protein [Longimicrobiales bacterium]
MRRLVLFDIDGTLLTGGPAKEAFTSAMMETYGTLGDVDRVSFGGKTDPQIARELLTGAGLDARAIDAGLPLLWERYLGHLRTGLAERPMRVLPGVREALDALGALEDVALGLLTGNILGGAELKLGSAGLWERFGVGGFGSDHEDRDRLPEVALERARRRWGPSIGPADTVIVGDTPRDVGCGRVCGARTLAVATGTFSAAELEEAGADHVLADLTATDRLLELLLG